MTRRAIYVRRYSAVALARYMRKLCRHLPDMAKDKETTEAEQMLGELRLAIESLAAELVIILGEACQMLLATSEDADLLKKCG
jgi:hypothetical protein